MLSLSTTINHCLVCRIGNQLLHILPLPYPKFLNPSLPEQRFHFFSSLHRKHFNCFFPWWPPISRKKKEPYPRLIFIKLPRKGSTNSRPFLDDARRSVTRPNRQAPLIIPPSQSKNKILLSLAIDRTCAKFHTTATTYRKMIYLRNPARVARN